MPYLFAEDVASLLLMSGGLLVQGSLLARVVDGLDAEACSPVEVLGWLYQFYVAERKDEVFAGYKKRKKAQAADIAPATQLFTPEWIVRYLAQNSAVASYALTILAPTLHFEVGQVAKLPILGPARPRKGAGPQRVEVAINFMSL